MEASSRRWLMRWVRWEPALGLRVTLTRHPDSILKTQNFPVPHGPIRVSIPKGFIHITFRDNKNSIKWYSRYHLILIVMRCQTLAFHSHDIILLFTIIFYSHQKSYSHLSYSDPGYSIKAFSYSKIPRNWIETELRRNPWLIIWNCLESQCFV